MRAGPLSLKPVLSSMYTIRLRIGAPDGTAWSVAFDASMGRGTVHWKSARDGVGA
jgi:hypothetical protein